VTKTNEEIVAEIFGDNEELTIAPPVVRKPYTRKERRTGRFVIKNRSNGKYLKLVIEGETGRFTDVQLSLATQFDYDEIGEVMYNAVSTEPSLLITYERIGKDKRGNIKTH
jgi:hypothetical protein